MSQSKFGPFLKAAPVLGLMVFAAHWAALGMKVHAITEHGVSPQSNLLFQKLCTLGILLLGLLFLYLTQKRWTSKGILLTFVGGSVLVLFSNLLIGPLLEPGFPGLQTLPQELRASQTQKIILVFLILPSTWALMAQFLFGAYLTRIFTFKQAGLAFPLLAIVGSFSELIAGPIFVKVLTYLGANTYFYPALVLAMVCLVLALLILIFLPADNFDREKEGSWNAKDRRYLILFSLSLFAVLPLTRILGILWKQDQAGTGPVNQLVPYIFMIGLTFGIFLSMHFAHITAKRWGRVYFRFAVLITALGLVLGFVHLNQYGGEGYSLALWSVSSALMGPCWFGIKEIGYTLFPMQHRISARIVADGLAGLAGVSLPYFIALFFGSLEDQNFLIWSGAFIGLAAIWLAASWKIYRIWTSSDEPKTLA